MVFGWMRRRRVERLRREGRTVAAQALIQGSAPSPKRLVLIDLGYGPEVWADYGSETRFRKQGRIISDGKLVLDPGQPKALASTLRLPLEPRMVKF